MCHRAIALIALILVSLLALSHSASAQDGSVPPATGGLESPIGKVVTVDGSATIEHTAVVVQQVSTPSGPDKAKVGDFLYTGDVIQTGADSKVSLVFADGTALNVFSNARMKLDEFVYRPNSTWNSSLFNLAKGTLTVVGGTMAKTGRMRIDTPIATMGIRGTTAHIEVAEDGTVRFSTLIEEKR
jgi:hypothetical protein